MEVMARFRFFGAGADIPMYTAIERSGAMPILFYRTTGRYGCFSNFSPHGFDLDGAYWPTSEHYFQAQKFAHTSHAEDVRLALRPAKAAAIGREHSRPLRPDWEEIKDDVMRRAVLCKFQQHAGIRAILLGTGEAEIIENSPKDAYWGCGADGKGKNRLGLILMETREILRSTKEESV